MNLEFDISEISKEFNLSPKTSEILAKSVLDDVTAAILYNWQTQAKLKLRGTLGVYLNNLKWVESGRLKNTLILMGNLPNMLESGSSPFDMKAGFQKSDKVKYNKKGGWYLTVPFRWATPNSIGSSNIFAGVLPQSVYNDIINQVKPKTTNIGGGGQKGSSFKAKGMASGERKEIVTEGSRFDTYKHKSSIYQGIQRNSKTYEGATQSTYVSFRRVGANSDPNAFIHSGFIAGNFADKALNSIDFNNLVDNSIESFLGQNNLL